MGCVTKNWAIAARESGAAYKTLHQRRLTSCFGEIALMLIMARISNAMPPKNWQKIDTEDMSRLANFYLYVTNDTFLKVKATFSSDPRVENLAGSIAALDSIAF
jgi:hypothetical protein